LREFPAVLALAQAERIGELRVHPVFPTWQLFPGFGFLSSRRWRSEESAPR
jgi:hypothetical protein